MSVQVGLVLAVVEVVEEVVAMVATAGLFVQGSSGVEEDVPVYSDAERCSFRLRGVVGWEAWQNSNYICLVIVPEGEVGSTAFAVLCKPYKKSSTRGSSA